MWTMTPVGVSWPSPLSSTSNSPSLCGKEYGVMCWKCAAILQCPAYLFRLQKAAVVSDSGLLPRCKGCADCAYDLDTSHFICLLQADGGTCPY